MSRAIPRPAGPVALPLLLIALLVPASPAAAQEEAPRGSRDATFARRLFESGHLALAEEVARETMERSEYARGPRGDCAFLLADIARRRAERTSDPDERRRLLDEQEELLTAAQESFPDHQRVGYVGLDRLRALLQEAENLLTAAREAVDPAEREEALTQARSQFEQVFAGFDEAIQTVRQEHDEQYEEYLNARREGQQATARQLRGELQDLAYRRNLAEFLHADGRLQYAETFEEGMAGREEAWQQALDAYLHFYSNRHEFFPLWARSLIGAGKAFRALDRLDESEEILGVVPTIEPNFDVEDMDESAQAEFRVMLRDIRMEGAAELAKTRTAMGRTDEAIRTCDAVFEQYPNARETHWGRLVVFEKGSALVTAGRVAEGAMLVHDEVIVPSTRNRAEHIGDWDLDVYGVAACKKLASILEENPVIFPAPAQFRAGQGFYFRNQLQEAAWAFKAVESGARTEEERNEYVPRALLLLGDCYMRTQRWLEGGIAFAGIRDSAPQARTALQKAKVCYERMEEAHPNVRFFSNKVTETENRLIQVQGTGEGAQAIKFERAQEQESNGRYEQAAQTYSEVEEWTERDDGEQVRFRYYGASLVGIGACFYKAWRAEGRSGRSTELLDRAREALEEALAYAEENDLPNDPNDDTARAGGSYWLGAILMDSENPARDPARAIEVLQPFAGAAADHSSYGARGLSLLVEAEVEEGRLEAAEEHYATLAEEHEGTQDQVFAAFYLADHHDAEGTRLVEAGRHAAASRARAKAADYAHDWIRSLSEDRKDFDAYDWAGVLLYKGESWSAAAEVYREMLRRFGPEGQDPVTSDEDRQALQVARLNLAWASYEAGSVDEAIETFASLKEEYPREYRVLSGLASALFDKVRAMYGPEDEVSPEHEPLVRRLEQALTEYQARLEAIGQGGFQRLVRQLGLPESRYEIQRARTVYRRLLVDYWSRRWQSVVSTIDLRSRTHAYDDLVYRQGGLPVTGVVVERTDEEVVVRDWSVQSGLGDQETRIPADEVNDVVEFPDDLREKFVELRAAAAERAR